MKRILSASIAILLCSLCFGNSPARVACIGDSITYGYGIEDRETYSYPSQLQVLLGNNYEVGNFGNSARVMSNKGELPFMKEDTYADAKAFLPDIVTIMLGTNDTKPWNWSPDDFRSSFHQMIGELKGLPTHPDIYVCLPPPSAEDKWGINDSTLVAGVIPIAREVADWEGLEIIDVYSPLSGHPEMYVDGIHPDKDGAAIIAGTLLQAFRDNGWSKTPGKKVVFIGDSITDGYWGANNGRPSSERSHYDMNHIYGHGYVEYCASLMLEKYPQRHYRFFNRGISANGINDLAARWDEDVLALRPDVVSILIGINDTFTDNGEDMDTAAWEATYRDLIERTLKACPSCTIVLCTPFIAQRGRAGRGPRYGQYHSAVMAETAIVKRLATEYKLKCADFNAIIEESVRNDKSGDRNYWLWDGYHPTPQAHLRMARLWLKTVKL